MQKPCRSVAGLLMVLATILCTPSALWGHGMVGQRMFIEPLVTEDANIKNELDLPRGEFLTMPEGSFRTLGISFEKTLYPDRWSVVVEQSIISRHVPGRTVTGLDDPEVGTKIAVYRNEPHEFVLTPAFFVTVPTGSRKVAEHRTAVHPEILFAKGFGDLKTAWLRPLALKGDVGYESTTTGTADRQANYDMVLMYSMSYLNHFVRKADTGFELEHNLRLGHSAGAILGDMFPFVEWNGSSPVAGTSGPTTTFLRPGTLYMGKYFQLSVAADIPVSGYLPSQRIGGMVLMDLFLDEITPAFGGTPFGKHHRHEE